MTVFVLDNSVTMRWCFENATYAYAESVLQTLASGHDAFLAVLQSLNIILDHDGTERILTDVHRKRMVRISPSPPKK